MKKQTFTHKVVMERGYTKVEITKDIWVVTEQGHDYNTPNKACTFAFDTENLTLFDGKVLNNKQLFKRVRNLNNDAKRKRLSCLVWAWQVYDEVNGFFMTNDFNTLLQYLCKCSYKFGWCYNATFDFSQIDYEILAKGKDVWKPHEHAKKGEAYNKGQPYTYESLHNDMGARYAYKLWVPYKNASRHTYTHAIEIRDFMKLVTGGLARLLDDLNVVDNEGNPIRKLTMDYQGVNTTVSGLTDAEIDYCCNDVKGLYFAIKMFNSTLEEQSNNELHIYGDKTNIMTAGGMAKRELLRSLYPNIKPQFRLEKYQKQHPMKKALDTYLRENHLYRGGITFVNPYYKGKLIRQKMYRYDVNSEYPYIMSEINDLVGKPIKMSLVDYDKMPNKNDYEAVYIMTSVYGVVKENYMPIWYDPFKRDYVKIINEEGTHLMFERELNEMLNWYDDISFTCNEVILWKKGQKVYAPFVNENYELKAQAKRDGNKTLLTTTKLKLNSSYGKLAERVERGKGYYELNEETGAIHFIHEGTELDAKSVMSVAVGALVTASARVFILSKIREVCGNDIKHNFIYIDTDSIHCLNNYDKANAYKLGGLKLEAICDACKYIAPKTYIDINTVDKDGTVAFKINNKANYEVHSKGINIKSIEADLLKKQKYKKNGKMTLKLIDNKIEYGTSYICLVAMNVKGGKVLVPTIKYLAREELRPHDEDSDIVLSNVSGASYIER